MIREIINRKASTKVDYSMTHIIPIKYFERQFNITLYLLTVLLFIPAVKSINMHIKKSFFKYVYSDKYIKSVYYSGNKQNRLHERIATSGMSDVNLTQQRSSYISSTRSSQVTLGIVNCIHGTSVALLCSSLITTSYEGGTSLVRFALLQRYKFKKLFNYL